MSESAGTKPARSHAIHWRILIGLVLGVVLGLAANWLASSAGPDSATKGWIDWLASQVAEPLGRVFLRLVMMVVVPLVFSALALGVYEIGDLGKLGRVGLRTLGLTLVMSASAVLIGITLVNTLKPGRGLPAEKSEALRAQFSTGAEDAVRKSRAAKPLKDLLLDIIPENPLQEMVGAVDGSSKGNGMLAVMFCALIVGVALSTVGERGTVLVRVFEGVFDVSMAIIGFAMRIAPFAVACLVFAVVARLGGDILTTLIWFVITVTVGLLFHLIVVYSVVIAVFARMNPLNFFRGVVDAMVTAFGTSSSNATLPTAIRVAQEDLKLPPEIVRFVLTVGATGNQNGTALYEGVVVLFLAQVFGVDLSLQQQVLVVLMSILAGVGTAGVPGGSLPLIVILLQSVGVPGEGIGLILGIDRVLDMGRTVLNVTGDLAIATCVGKMEERSAPHVAPQPAA